MSLVIFRGQKRSRDVPSYSEVTKVLCHLNIGQKTGIVFSVLYCVFCTVLCFLCCAVFSVLCYSFYRITLVGFRYN